VVLAAVAPTGNPVEARFRANTTVGGEAKGKWRASGWLMVRRARGGEIWWTRGGSVDPANGGETGPTETSAGGGAGEGQ
jgi:hypothetical protein